VQDLRLSTYNYIYFSAGKWHSPHWGLAAQAYQDKKFPGRWTDREDPLPWPPHSPNIRALDFFMWGYVKNIVYEFPVTGIANVKKHVTDALINY
jgi:hypothetical protein